MVFTSMAPFARTARRAGCALICQRRCSFAIRRAIEGGELVIEDTYGQHRVKLPAGHLVLYPASSLHCVTPVTRGVRQASFLWIQSMVRDDKQRAMLYDLDRTIQSLKARFGDGEEVLSLLNMYHNLLRQWTEV